MSAWDPRWEADGDSAGGDSADCDSDNCDSDAGASDAKSAAEARELAREASLAARREAFLALRSEASRRGLPFYNAPGAGIIWAAMSAPDE